MIPEPAFAALVWGSLALVVAAFLYLSAAFAGVGR
jgi:hypothetical protein